MDDDAPPITDAELLQLWNVLGSLPDRGSRENFRDTLHRLVGDGVLTLSLTRFRIEVTMKHVIYSIRRNV
jgi:hypothetical protein